MFMYDELDVPSAYTSQPIHATPNIDGATPYVLLDILTVILVSPPHTNKIFYQIGSCHM